MGAAYWRLWKEWPSTSLPLLTQLKLWYFSGEKLLRSAMHAGGKTIIVAHTPTTVFISGFCSRGDKRIVPEFEGGGQIQIQGRAIPY